MKKKHIFFLRDRDRIIKIETNHPCIRELFGFHFSLLTKQNPLRNSHFSKEDIFLRVNLTSNNRIKLKTSSLSFLHNENHIFLFSTPMGSWLNMDLLRGRGRCNIIKDDRLGKFILPNIIHSLMARKMIPIHSAWIKTESHSFLLIGKSNAGKSTLSRLLLKEDGKYKLINDDSTIIQPLGRNVYAYALEPNIYRPISHLFFIHRAETKKSQVYPISCKEAFKRIIFFSDIILRKNDTHIDFRLETLKKLVFRTHSFILVNGQDLKNNPGKLNQLVNSALKIKQG